VTALRVVAMVLILVTIVVPTALYASTAAPAGHHVSLRHAPRTSPASVRATAVAFNVRPVLMLVPGPSLASPADARTPTLPLAAPFVPPRG
jgi:hypothetical protein